MPTRITPASQLGYASGAMSRPLAAPQVEGCASQLLKILKADTRLWGNRERAITGVQWRVQLFLDDRPIRMPFGIRVHDFLEEVARSASFGGELVHFEGETAPWDD